MLTRVINRVHVPTAQVIVVDPPEAPLVLDQGAV